MKKSYETLSGSITVLSVDKYRVKLKFYDLKFKLDFSSNIFGDDYENGEFKDSYGDNVNVIVF